MSTCISKHGEFSHHEPTETAFVCDLCGVFDEEAAIAMAAVVAHWVHTWRDEVLDRLTIEQRVPLRRARADLKTALRGAIR